MSLHPSSSQALHTGAIGLIGALAGMCVAEPALAGAARVGTAASIDRSVTGNFGGGPVVMSVGDDVNLRETVQTDSSGQARLVLVDDTDVAVLSRSTITVERYAPGSKLVSTPDGTFLVHTRHRTPGEPQFDTSAGTLVPQGTRFWFDVRKGRIKLDVQEGAVRFCPRGKSQAYCVLATAGHAVLGSAGAPAQVLGMSEPTPPAPPAPPVYPTGINYHPTANYPNTNNTNAVPSWPRSHCVQMENCGCGQAGGYQSIKGHDGCGNGVDGGSNTAVRGPNGGESRWTKTGDGGTYTGSSWYRPPGHSTTDSSGRKTGGGEGYPVDKWNTPGASGTSAGVSWSNPKYSEMANSYTKSNLMRGNPAGNSMRGYPGPTFQAGARAAWPFRRASGFGMGGSGVLR